MKVINKDYPDGYINTANKIENSANETYFNISVDTDDASIELKMDETGKVLNKDVTSYGEYDE